MYRVPIQYNREFYAYQFGKKLLGTTLVYYKLSNLKNFKITILSLPQGMNATLQQPENISNLCF